MKVSPFLLLCLFTVFSYGQFQRHAVEVSFSGTFGTHKLNGTPLPYSVESQTYAFVTTSAEYYVTDIISVGPQYGILAEKNDPPAHSAVLKLSLTKRIGETPLAYFITGGIGKANAVTIPMAGGVLPALATKDWDVKVLTGGAGLKLLVSDAVAFKMELNYREEKFTRQDYFFVSYSSSSIQLRTVDYVHSNTSLLMGFSVIL